MAQASTHIEPVFPSAIKDYLAGEIVTVGTEERNGSVLQSLAGRYGWVPQNRDSLYVSALVYYALGQHRFSPANARYTWILAQQQLDHTQPNTGSFKSDLRDTAAALLWLPLSDPNRRTLAREYLARQQEANGSWHNDLFLTGLCLEALAKPEVLYVWSGVANAHDSAVQALLEARGYRVVLMADTEAVPQNLSHRELVFISGTANPANIDQKFREAEVPVIVSQAALYEAFGLVAPGDDHFGTAADQSTLALQESGDHRVSAGFDVGPLTVQAPGVIAWGIPNEEATVIATLSSDPTKAAIFIYEWQAFMAGGIRAPARRVGFFFKNADTLTAEGQDLLDAALEWAMAKRRLP